MASTTATERKMCETNLIPFHLADEVGIDFVNENTYNNILFLYLLAKELVKRKNVDGNVRAVLKKHIALLEKGGVALLISNDINKLYTPPTKEELVETTKEFSTILRYVFKTDLALNLYFQRFSGFLHHMREVIEADCPCCVKEGRKRA